MAGLLTANELTLMRARASAMLPSTCTIQTVSTVSDGQGGETETWANTYTSIACKLSAANTQGDERSFGAQYQVHGEWVLSVAFDQAIAAGNRAVVNSDTYEVLRVQDDHDYRILRRAELRRID